MITDNGTFERVVGDLVGRVDNTIKSMETSDRCCEVCDVEEHADYIGPADLEVNRYRGVSIDGCVHTIDAVELTSDILFENTSREIWKQSCEECDRARAISDLRIERNETIRYYKLGVRQLTLTNMHEHHTSYLPEETMLVCNSCHTKIHQTDGFHDDLKPSLSRGEFDRIKANE